MNKKFLSLTTGIFIFTLLFLSFISAVWYNPLTWFSQEAETIPIDTIFQIEPLEQSWIVLDATGEYNNYIANSSDKKTHLGWYLKDGIDPLTADTTDKFLYDCDGTKILDDKNKPIILKYETNKIPNTNEPDGMSNGYFIRLTDASLINIDSCIQLSPTIVYQNISQVIFTKDNLQINNTLKKWNEEEFVISPEDIWIETPNNKTFKFGANDTIAKEDTQYQYLWNSNKPIKYEVAGNYYYFDEEYTGENHLVKFYERNKLNLYDICTNIILTNETDNSSIIKYPNCSYELKDYTHLEERSLDYEITICDEYQNITYQRCIDWDEFDCIQNESYQVEECTSSHEETRTDYWNETMFDYSELKVNFTGFYNSTSDMVFIDPVISYTNVTSTQTYNEQVQTEAEFSHLNINDTSLVGYWSFDENARDLTTNDNDGTLTGNAFINSTGGQYGGGLQLDGSGDYVTIGGLADMTSVTYATWVYSNSSYDSSIETFRGIIGNNGLNAGDSFLRKATNGYYGDFDSSKWTRSTIVAGTSCTFQSASTIPPRFRLNKNANLDFTGVASASFGINSSLFDNLMPEGAETLINYSYSFDWTWSTNGDNSKFTFQNIGTAGSAPTTFNTESTSAGTFSFNSAGLDIVTPTSLGFRVNSSQHVGTGIAYVSNFIFNAYFNDSSSQIYYVEYGGGHYDFGLHNVIAVNSETVSQDGWHFVVGTYNGNTGEAKLYLDESVVDSDTWTTGLTIVSPDWIGQEFNANRGWNGSIDEVMIFNRALNSTEISEIYNSTYSRFYPEGNQTFSFENITSGYNRVNLTAEAEALNGSSLNATIWEADVDANSGYIDNNTGFSETGLVGYWHGDGNALDYSGNGNDGTFAGDANANAEGVFNNSFSFDGTGDYVSINNFGTIGLSATSYTKTVSIWTKGSGLAVSTPRLTNSIGDASISVLPNGSVSYRVQSQGYSSPFSFVIQSNLGASTTDWNNYIVIINMPATTTIGWYNTSIIFSVNGVYEERNFSYYKDSVSIGNFLEFDIGRHRNSGWGSTYFTGQIDEVMIFNRSLSATEIKSLYITGSTDHRNDGVGVNWTTTDGTQPLGVLNSTHLQYPNYTIQTDSNYLLPEFRLDSGEYYFYSPILKSLLLETWNFDGEDTTPPTLTVSNITEDNETAISADFNATDASGIDYWWINDTTNFKIDQTGQFENNTLLNAGIYSVNISVNDTVGNVAWEVIKVNLTEVAGGDAEAPVFTTIPADDSITYGENWTGVNFDATDNIAIDVYFINDTTNFNINSTGYLDDVNILGAGTYSINVSVNDTSGNINSTIYTLTVNKATPTLNYYLNGVTDNVSINYPNTINASGYANVGTLGMWRNGTDVLSENNLDISLGANYYQYEFNITGNENYTDVSSVYLYAEVNQSNSNCDVLFNETSPLNYGNSFKVYSNCDSGFQLFRNGSEIINNSEQSLDAGSWNFTVTRNDTINYTNIYDEELFTINKLANPLTLTITPSATETYGTETTATCSADNGSPNLFRNDSSVSNPDVQTLGAGTYNYTCNISESTNYLANSTSQLLTISKATTGLTLDVTNVTYPVNGIINASESNTGDGDLTYNLYINGVLETSGSDIDLEKDLAVGVYSIEYNTTGGANWTSSSTIKELEIYANTGNCNVTLNVTSPITYGENVLVTTDCSSGYTLNLNESSISNNSIHDLGAGTWNFSVQRTDTVNYSNVYDEELLTINQATPTGSLTGTTPIIYGTTGDVEGTESNTGDGDLTYKLYRNGVEVSNPDNSVLAVGTYNYVYNTTGGENYTANLSLDTFELVVNQANAQCSVLFNETSPLEYPNSFLVWHTCEPTATLYRNGTIITNNTEQSLEIGTWNFTVIADDTTNYTNTTDEELFTINPIPTPLNVPTTITTITGTLDDGNVTSTQVYGEGQTYNISEVTGTPGFLIEMNFTNFTTFDSLLLVYNYDGNIGHNVDVEAWNGTDWKVIEEFVGTTGFVNHSIGMLNDTELNIGGNISIRLNHISPGNVNHDFYLDYALLQVLNDTTPPYFTTIPANDTITYGNNWTGVDFDATDDEQTFAHYSVNDSKFTINSTGYLDEVSILPAGTYNLNITINNTFGLENSTVYKLTVNKITSTCTVVDGSVTYPTPVSVSGSCTNPETSSQLFVDDVLISSPFEEILGVDTYTFKVNVSATENYTSASDDKIVTVSQGNPVSYMSINNNNSNDWSYDSDVTLIISGNETTTGDGDLTYNLFIKGVGVTNPNEYSFMSSSNLITFNTTGGQNWSYGQITQTLTIGAVVTPTVSTPVCRYKKLMYYNPDLAWIKQEGCI